MNLLEQNIAHLRRVCPRRFTWRRQGFRLEAIRVRWTDDHRWEYAYQLFDRGVSIFTGEHFCTPGLACDPTGTSARMRRFLIAELLGFLTLQPGDTDDDYFAGYTPVQLAWAVSERGRELALLALEMAERRV